MSVPKKTDLQSAKRLLDVVPPAMRVIRQELRSHAGADLTVPQFRVMVHVSRRSRNNGELAELQGVSRSAMSRMVDALVEKALVVRQASETDSRSVDISLTGEGRAAYEEMRRKAQRRFAQVLARISAEDKQVLMAGLAVLEGVVAAYDTQD